MWAAVSAAYSALLSSSNFERINDDDDDDDEPQQLRLLTFITEVDFCLTFFA